MKKSRFTEAHIMGVLRQAEGGMPVPELCREHGISSATFYKWRAKYGGMDASMMSQMKALEDENRRLKRMFADLSMRPICFERLWEKSDAASSAPRAGREGAPNWSFKLCQRSRRRKSDNAIMLGCTDEPSDSFPLPAKHGEDSSFYLCSGRRNRLRPIGPQALMRQGRSACHH